MTVPRRRELLPLLFAAACAAPVVAQVSPGGPTVADEVLGKPFTSHVEGVEFRPPADGTIERQLNSGEVVRYQWPDRGWTLVLKEAVNSTHLPMVIGPTAAPTTAPTAAPARPVAVPEDRRGLLDLAAAQLTDRAGKPAELVRKDLVPVGPRQVGLIEARDSAGTDRLFIQLALIPDRLQRYFALELIAPAAGERAAREAFQRTLATVVLLDRATFRHEQDRRQENTRLLWVQVDRHRIESVLQPVHFLRVVREGRDVGYVQVNEQVEQLHKQDGLFVVCREHLVTPPAPAAAPPASPPTSAGVDLPRPGGAAVPSQPTRLDREAKFFVTFDREHESWSAQTRLDDRPSTDAFELGNSDAVLLRRLNVQAMEKQGPLGRGQPPVLNPMVDTLQVDNYQGATPTGKTYTQRVDFRYLPQALAQLLPRLVPVDEPKQYLFAFYVSEQRATLARYVDVGLEREVTLDGQVVRAVPIGDRVGADGVVTTHYVNRADGQWLGTSGDDGRLLVLPTDADTLRKAWPAFTVLPDPPPPVENEPVRQRVPDLKASDLMAPPPGATPSAPSLSPSASPSLSPSGIGGR